MPLPFLAVLLAAPLAAAPAEPPADIRPYQSLHLELPYTPPIARIDGEDRLIYELHATNFSTRTLAITSVDVRVAADGKRVARIDPAGAMRRVGAATGPANHLAPGQRAIFYLSVPWTGGSPSPLVHHLSFVPQREDGTSDPVTIAGAAFTPRPAYAATLGAPLRGGPWAAIALPDIDNGHRRFPYAVRGRVHIPGRHAIDWMPAAGFDPASTGQGVAPDGSGADVLAVADAEIVSVKTECAAGARPNVEDETGAMIVLRLADGRHAFYQHLAPGLSLRAGMRVRRGQVIGKVGASGHVTQPHLHFHIADGPTPLDSEGVPYRFGAGRIAGQYRDIADFDAGKPWQAEAPRPIDGLPPANAVILFDPARP
jgi:murein DD-endopeptidase